MGKPMSFAEKNFLGYALIDLAYRDYIAARFLLNNRFIIQGLTLASTAIEKYLKSLIVFTSEEKRNYNFHMDRVEKLKDLLVKNKYDVTNKFDPVFLEILEKVYKIRYYDNLKKPVTIGLYLNQFIGELDYTIDFLENSITSISSYKKAVKNKDPHLYENNFILTKQGKKQFMEKSGPAFSIYILTSESVHREEIAIGENITVKYEGCLSTFNDFDYKWSVLKQY
jgi:HEPN domain-containing protein